MSSIHDLKAILSENALRAKKKLGQNFLVDPGSLRKIVEAADLGPSDRVVEVGPGTGLLTEKLIQKAAHVTAIEFDPDMVVILKDRFGEAKKLKLIHSDILEWKIDETGDYKVVANIPYYITSPLLRHFLQEKIPPVLMVVLVQKEVADKVCGKSGKSVITLETQLFGKPSIVGIVKAGSFYPAPKVDSAILKIQVHPKLPLGPADMDLCLDLIKAGYSQKRKKLYNNLARFLKLSTEEVKGLLGQISLNPDCRAEDLETGDWVRLVEKLTKNNK